jgi:hypothetical protein
MIRRTAGVRRAFATAAASFLKPLDSLVTRHIGPRENEVSSMLSTMHLSSLEELTAKVVPEV